MSREREKWYNIQIYYLTGDSAEANIAEYILAGKWKDLDLARENLLRIEEHFNWKRGYLKNMPDFMNEMKENLWDTSIPFKLDDGETWVVGVFWDSWCDHINSAKVIEDLEPLPSIKFLYT